MLCKIDATVGGTVTDKRAVAMNYLRALEAICTANAGSTPSVPSQTANTASPSGTNVIVQVISNAEAGGWTSSNSTNITSNYNPSFGSPYQLDLFRDSGKGTYPFQKLSFRTSVYNLFNGNFTTYPNLHVTHGFNTVANASGGYLLGTDLNGGKPDSGGRPGFKFEATDWYGDTTGSSYMSLKFDNREAIIACTQDYFIILDGGVLAQQSTGRPGNFLYVGRRTTQAWEDAYGDNPPLVSVCYNASSSWSLATGSNASMFARTYHSSGTVNNDPLWYRIQNWDASSPFSSVLTGSAASGGGRFINPFTGYTAHSQAMSSYMFPLYYFGNEMQVPMVPGYHMQSTGRQDNLSHVIPPVSDSNGNFVPPAYPITFARNVLNSHNAGGRAIGVYASMGGTRSFVENYVTNGQEFNLGGETYYAYTIGNTANYCDVFLVRKA